MTRKIIVLHIFLSIFLLLSGCSNPHPYVNKTNISSKVIAQKSTDSSTKNLPPKTTLLQKTASSNKGITLTKLPEAQIREKLTHKYAGVLPLQWGENVSGVKTKMNTTQKVIALTFDACGGKYGDGYDQKLIQYLILHHIPATLFINGRWIDANNKTFMDLAKNPLFEIENHGIEHRPLSVTGKSAYGIKGTKSIGQVVDEVYLNQEKIWHLTGKKPKFFRSGTAYYDEVAVKIVQDLGEQAVNFSVLGDAGATFSTNQIVKQFKKAKPGSIIIFHMNHPEKDTAEGVIKAIPLLEKEGYHFVKLENYTLR